MNIDPKKANIGDGFTAKTASHIQKLREAFSIQDVFERADVQRILELKPTMPQDRNGTKQEIYRKAEAVVEQYNRITVTLPHENDRLGKSRKPPL